VWDRWASLFSRSFKQTEFLVLYIRKWLAL
jgi:hypothetical protein